MKKNSNATILAKLLRDYPKIQAQKNTEYKLKIFQKMAQEADTEQALDIIVYLYENHHKEFARPKKPGRKLKWTPEIQAMLAVYIETRKDKYPKRSIDKEIEELLKYKIWKNFAQKGVSTPLPTNGHTTFRENYKKGKGSKLFEKEMNLLNQDLNIWVERLIRNIS